MNLNDCIRPYFSNAHSFVSKKHSPEGISEHVDRIEQNLNQAVITGLHACGDLSSATLKWFVSNSSLVGLSLVSCCYHKMVHFPMSKTYENCIFGIKKDVASNELIEKFSCLRSPFALRLASQEPFTR